MILLEKWMILAPLQKLPYNVGDLGKTIVATCFEKLPSYFATKTKTLNSLLISQTTYNNST